TDAEGLLADLLLHQSRLPQRRERAPEWESGERREANRQETENLKDPLTRSLSLIHCIRRAMGAPGRGIERVLLRGGAEWDPGGAEWPTAESAGLQRRKVMSTSG